MAQCGRCLKDIHRQEDECVEGKPEGGPVIYGKIVFYKKQHDIDPKDIAYLNRQLGRYSDGNGECDVRLCYECMIDVELGRIDTIALPDGK